MLLVIHCSPALRLLNDTLAALRCARAESHGQCRCSLRCVVVVTECASNAWVCGRYGMPVARYVWGMFFWVKGYVFLG